VVLAALHDGADDVVASALAEAALAITDYDIAFEWIGRTERNDTRASLVATAARLVAQDHPSEGRSILMSLSRLLDGLWARAEASRGHHAICLAAIALEDHEFATAQVPLIEMQDLQADAIVCLLSHLTKHRSLDMHVISQLRDTLSRMWSKEDELKARIVLAAVMAPSGRENASSAVEDAVRLAAEVPRAGQILTRRNEEVEVLPGLSMLEDALVELAERGLAASVPQMAIGVRNKIDMPGVLARLATVACDRGDDEFYGELWSLWEAQGLPNRLPVPTPSRFLRDGEWIAWSSACLIPARLRGLRIVWDVVTALSASRKFVAGRVETVETLFDRVRSLLDLSA
jgi:hypothetical protein